MKQSRERRGRRVVVDTSVVISGIAAFKRSFVARSTDSGDLLFEWVEKDRFIWLVSTEVLDENKRVATRLKVRPSVAGRLINLLKEEAEEVVVEGTVELSPGPGDNCFCACAQDGRADFLVTLNPKDFPQNVLSAEVVSPAAFLSLMRRRRGVR